MCHLATATCNTCQELQTVLVRHTATTSHPHAITSLTNEFHLPCENAKLTGKKCCWLFTWRFSATIPEVFCKKCQMYRGEIDYQTWLWRDMNRRNDLLNCLDVEKSRNRNSWWKVFLC
ncbi:uncharacterized protein CTRU02_203158 [Colletotrichum truncatum]|uniref:Uncharacterized protein n=1 Tax=Colletotrichum truncatum TaxID=5467 RepID=A0ACC3Z8R4_COLTU|nr:uncharacterized protein CTRU02_08998 [Colletotrichum truncatum]KAF6789206.1 hypothetical protein CTRU02_08998 [Colletotrichum truncatum]